MKPEEALQRAVVQYLDMQYPKVRFCATLGELRKNKTQAGIAKGMGYRKGIPDLMVYAARFDTWAMKYGGNGRYYSGLALELKSKTGRLRKEQKEWIAYLEQEGWRCEVVDDFDEAKRIIDEYLK